MDLFSGGGFGARGAVNAGGSPILAVDAWELAAKTYKDNFPEADVLCNTIQSLNPKQLSKKYKPDILLTSPECTSHSIARGNRPVCEKSRETAIDIIPWIQAMKPRWIILENVNRMKNWGRHAELIKTIESQGYAVSDMLLNASDFGTPQSRKRMFLIGSLDGYQITKSELISLNRKRRKTAKSIIQWNKKYKSKPLYSKGRAEATIERAERAIKELGKNVPFLIVYYGSDYAGGWQSIDSPLRTITTIDRFGLVTWEDETPLLRMLQPDELLIAMGAGKSHKLSNGSRRDKIKLCGNGVCSPVMETIFKKINLLDQKRYLIAS